METLTQQLQAFMLVQNQLNQPQYDSGDEGLRGDDNFCKRADLRSNTIKFELAGSFVGLGCFLFLGASFILWARKVWFFEVCSQLRHL